MPVGRLQGVRRNEITVRGRGGGTVQQQYAGAFWGVPCHGAVF